MIEEILAEERKILNENWVTNIVAAFGSPEKTCIVSPSEDNIYSRLWDLASVTKIYSLITILSLHEQGLFDITKRVKDYSDNYPNISNLHIYELLNFSYELNTSSRIGIDTSFNQAVDLLHGITIKSHKTVYSDMGIMVVVQLLNEIYHSELFFRDYTYKILNEINAKKTHWWKDLDSSETNIENYDYEYRCIDGKLIEVRTPLRTCHDSKARVLPYTGHSGLFSSADDISTFAIALLSGKIISNDTLSIVIDKKYDAWDETHHFGLLCNKKHPDEKYTEIPITCSDNSIAISGYTGTYLLLDFDRQSYIFIGANRIHNRITNLTHDNCEYKYPCTKDYVFRKDILVNKIANAINKDK